MWYNNPYLKGNIIVIPPLNNLSYHFINLGFTFVCSLFHGFVISSWWFSSHSRYLGFSASLLFWMSHWVLCSLWINSIPLYSIACDRSHIFSLIVNYNIIYCCVITVWKNDQGLQGISSTSNQIYEGWGIFVSMTYMNFKRRGFKNLWCNIGYYTFWTRHYLSVTST